jgi:hypothetical protein
VTPDRAWIDVILVPVSSTIASEAGNLAMFSQLDMRRMSRITGLLLRQLGNFPGP